MAYGKYITLDTPATERISRNLGILTGIVEFADYCSGNGIAATTLEDTEITDYFLTVYTVAGTGVTVTSTSGGTGGFCVGWNYGTSCFELYEISDAVPEAASGMFPCMANASGGAMRFAAFGLWR